MTEFSKGYYDPNHPGYAKFEPLPKTKAVWPKVIKYYLHSDRDSNYDEAAKLDLDGSAQQTFRCCCYEVELELEVYEDGSAYILSVNSVPLIRKFLAT